MEKIREDSQKVKKIGQVVNQAPAPEPKHDKIRAQWASNVPLENMLEKYDGVNALRWILEIEPFVAR